MYKYEDIKAVHLELTERCQAACPMCPRTGNAELRNAELSLDDIKKIFPLSFVQQLDRITLCGNYGEPIVAKDCLEIVRYFREHNHDMWITINTNAGARPSQWWSSLASIIGERGFVIFGIDGLSDTNHIYRVNVKWENAIGNAKHYMDAGGKACWDFIAFAHNEHQIEEAESLSKKMGFHRFRVKKSYRFGIYNNVELKPPSNLSNKAMDLFKQDKSFFDTCSISCKVVQSKEIYISAEGLLFPCCWIGGTRYGKDHQIRDLIGDLDRISCLKHNIRDVMNNGVLSQIQESWSKQSINQGKIRICAVQCNSKYDMFTEQFK